MKLSTNKYYGRTRPFLINVQVFICIVLSFVYADSPNKIIDGTPRIVISCRQWSWNTEFDAQMAGDVGITNWKYYSGQYNTIPVDDSLKMITGGYQGMFDWYKDTTFMRILNSKNDTPVVVICYCQLNYDPGKILSGPSDTALINLGVKKLKLFADTLKSRGVDWVIYTTHHARKLRWYVQYGSYDDCNDTLVLQEYSKQMGEICYANVASITNNIYPLHLTDDLEHPNSLLHSIYATKWLESLYLHDSISIPPSLEINLSNLATAEQAKRSNLAFQIDSLSENDTIRIGQPYALQIQGDASWINKTLNGQLSGYDIRLVVYRRFCVGMFDLGFVYPNSTQVTTTFTLPETSSVLMYPSSPDERVPIKSQFDSAKIMVTYTGFNYPIFQTSKKLFIGQGTDTTSTSITPPINNANQPYIVDYPNGGEVFKIGDPIHLNFHTNDSINYPISNSRRPSVWLSLDAGRSFCQVFDHIAEKEVPWIITDSLEYVSGGNLIMRSTISDSCLIRIQDYEKANISDNSDHFFKILPKSNSGLLHGSTRYTTLSGNNNNLECYSLQGRRLSDNVAKKLIGTALFVANSKNCNKIVDTRNGSVWILRKNPHRSNAK